MLTALPVPTPPAVTVLICTFNRAALLARTLESLAASPVTSRLPWDVVVVDNNSSDDTAAVVARLQPGYPVPLRYLHEPRQGKSRALNTGLASIRAAFVAFTDDDVQVEPGWLEAAIQPMLADPA